MTTLAVVLAALAAGSAAATIAADRAGRFGLVYAFKPLATGLVIALAVTRPQALTGAYGPFICAGLGCSLVGDVLMMLRRKRFVAGLAAFLAAHILYIAALVSRVATPLSLVLLIPYVLYLGFMAGRLGPRLGRMKVPVLAYMLVIMVMAAAAAQAYAQAGRAATLCALLGSILFVASDSFLAANRFVRAFPAAQAMILGTYYAAQILIALSI